MTCTSNNFFCVRKSPSCLERVFIGITNQCTTGAQASEQNDGFILSTPVDVLVGKKSNLRSVPDTLGITLMGVVCGLVLHQSFSHRALWIRATMFLFCCLRLSVGISLSLSSSSLSLSLYYPCRMMTMIVIVMVVILLITIMK